MHAVVQLSKQAEKKCHHWDEPHLADDAAEQIWSLIGAGCHQEPSVAPSVDRYPGEFIQN